MFPNFEKKHVNIILYCLIQFLFIMVVLTVIYFIFVVPRTKEIWPYVLNIIGNSMHENAQTARNLDVPNVVELLSKLLDPPLTDICKDEFGDYICNTGKRIFPSYDSNNINNDVAKNNDDIQINITKIVALICIIGTICICILLKFSKHTTNLYKLTFEAFISLVVVAIVYGSFSWFFIRKYVTMNMYRSTSYLLWKINGVITNDENWAPQPFNSGY